ncbi:MAG: glycosyltransferase family 4 protein [Gemmatimonadota bacterium]|nr:glycosyltransferase family 4 protein [Gemmatimonadota bacterium]
MTSGALSRRLWVVTECYPTPGAQNQCAFAHRQLAALARRDWDVQVVLPNGWFPPMLWRLAPAWRAARQRRVPASWQPDGVAVSDLVHQNRVPSRLSRPLDGGERIGEALASLLAAAVADTHRDLILCQFALPYGPSVAAACQRLGLHYAVYLRGDDVWVWPHDRDERMAAFRNTVRDASLVLAVSQTILTEARRLSQAPFNRAAVVPNGIDLERFRPVDSSGRIAARTALGIDTHTIVIICVGAAIARKGWRELLGALRDLPDVVLLAVTSSQHAEIDLAREHEALAPRLKVVFLHDVPGDAMPLCYAASNIFCLPTYGEGMSNALLEAMASGLPVVTTPVGGHPEAIADGADGYLVPPRDVQSLRRVLVSLARDQSCRQRVGLAARARAERIGSPDSSAERLDGLFSALLDGSMPAVLDPGSPYELAPSGGP